jgi:hypothetical protein
MADRRGPVGALVLVAVVLVVAGIGYAVRALSGSGDEASSGDAKGTLPTATSPGTAGPSSTHHRSHAGTKLISSLTSYYLVAGPRGPVLQASSTVAPRGTDVLELAMETLEEQPDATRDHTSWQPGWLGAATRANGHVDVDVSDTPASRPATLDAPTASVSLQQVVYTLQAATGSHDSVQFTRHGKPAASVLGVPTTRPLRAAPMAQVLSLMNVLEPQAEGGTMGRAPFRVAGTGNTAGGAVTVRLELHGRILLTRSGRMAGSGDLGRLYPWHLSIPMRGLANGTYQVVASGPDPVDPSLTVTDQAPLHLE